MQKRYINYYKKRKQKNVCLGCGSVKDREGKYCKKCLAKYDIRRKQLRSNNICTACRGPNDRNGKSYCHSCYEKYRKPIFDRIKNCIELGLCTAKNCDKPAITKNKNILCFDCWINRIATRLQIPVTICQKLWEKQNGKCRYTGVTLIPGKSFGDGASIDHITPTSKGGSNDEDNLQWVSYRVNTIKSDFSHEEFVEFCKMIYEKEKSISKILLMLF